MRQPVVALQEVGSASPPRPAGTPQNLIGGNQLAQLPGNMINQLPPYNFPGGPQEVRHTQWASRGIMHDVYFLQTDPNGDAWGGGRVNLAMVTERGADEVVIVPNPLGPTTAWAARASLGVRLGNTWYFSVHALSRSGGSDAPGLLANINTFVTSRGLNEEWVALGDWNRHPDTMAGQLPAGAAIYRTGMMTQQSGGELDWAVYSNGIVNGTMVRRVSATSSDHWPVLVGPMQAAAEPTPLFSTDRVVESMQAGGVLDASHNGTAAGTPIISGRRNGGDNQTFSVQQSSIGTFRFVGKQSGRCIASLLSSGLAMTVSSTTAVTLQDCSPDASQWFMPEYLGNNEFQLHSLADPYLCLNIQGGQTNPNDVKPIILWPCQNTLNERWVFTPAEASTTSAAQSPQDLSRAVPTPSTLESMKSGGVMDADHEHTGNGTALISWHRTGGTNQGWYLDWSGDGQTVNLRGVASNRCVDIAFDGVVVDPGRALVLWDCNGTNGQRWQPEQLDNGQVLLHSYGHPELCIDIDGAPANPDQGELILWTCSGAANQQWLFTAFDLTGDPVPEWQDPHYDELIALPDPGVPAERTAYFPSWSIYANEFYPKDLDARGIAGKLTTLTYAFENIDPVNLTCFAANKSGSPDESDPAGNDGASDAWADYQRGFTADISVDGTADTWDQPLKGNFNQLKKLKARYPNLKILVSLGGWTYSKYFSDVAATAATRAAFVSSCIDLYIRGNLPQIGDDPAGGTGVAAGIFDGFDIDWEFPASPNGHAGNHFGPQDTANYTALLAEFRSQLDALGHGHYRLTAAVPSGPGDIDKLDVPGLAQTLDMANIMSYDMHGAWETAGPTNFQAPLYDSMSSPAARSGLTVNDAINAYLMRGLPADKITMGVPLYGRGWTGVPQGGAHGLYQSVTGPTEAFPFSQQPGVAMYKELQAAGALANLYYDDQTKGSWVYDGTNFYSIESPRSLTAKRQYIKDKHLAGIMMYSLEADDLASTLLNAATGFID